MSIKTTHDVTRAFALAAIERKLPQANEEQLHNIWRTIGLSDQKISKAVTERKEKNPKNKSPKI